MSAIPLGVSSFKRRTGRIKEVLCVNMFLEKDPTNLVDQLARLQRPGLAPLVTLGDGPIRGVFQQFGSFGADIIAVSGPDVFRVAGSGATVLGVISGTDRVQIAASPTRALIATGTTCFSTDGGTITSVAMPDGRPVASVTYINGYFLLTQANSQRCYWIEPGQTDPDALSFFSAELYPDNLVRAEKIGDELWLFGEASTEVHIPTGVADLPFQRVEGRLFSKGCASRDTVAALDNTLFWVGQDLIAYRADNAPLRISDNSVEERLRESALEDLRAWAFALDGHTFYCLTMSQGTLVFDVSTGVWSEFRSFGRTAWRAHMGAQITGSTITAGDERTGDLWTLDPDRANDNGDPMIRELTGGVAVLGQPQACNSVTIALATGWGGLDEEPLLQLRWSDDEGNTWCDWSEIGLGLQGHYLGEVNFWRLGKISQPGRLFHLRFSDDSTFRVSYARMNEAFA